MKSLTYPVVGFPAHFARALVAFSLLTAATCSLTAQELLEPLIGVRAKVVEPAPAKPGEGLPDTHGKVYGILSVGLIQPREPLLKPVDSASLRSAVVRELSGHGFREFGKGEKPEILLTVQYGRSYLRNPYLDDPDVAAMPRDGEYYLTSSVSTKWDTNVEGRLMSNGIAAKIKESKQEYLCIVVTAWDYPKASGDKPKRLWTTTMTADDPEHRDLNQCYADMLAAGAAFFDHDIKAQRNTSRAVREGRVDVGTPHTIPEQPKS